MEKYRIFAQSVIGTKHMNEKCSCQDFADAVEIEGDIIQIMAIADGHGSGDCFRSEIGAKYAVQTAIEQAGIALAEHADHFSESGIQNFKYNLCQAWRNMVKKDWNERMVHGGLGENEPRYQEVSEKYRALYASSNPDVFEKHLYKAYGTTLLCAISIGTQLLLLQIGDGTCVVLRRNGEFCTPVPREEDNFLNVTVSLCQENAHTKIRHAVLDNNDNDPLEPVAIFLSSDGLDNCFPYEENEKYLYQKFYPVIINNILKQGFSTTEKEIAEELLPHMTNKSSKDDISLAYFITEDMEILEEASNGITDFLDSLLDDNETENIQNGRED